MTAACFMAKKYISLKEVLCIYTIFPIADICFAVILIFNSKEYLFWMRPAKTSWWRIIFENVLEFAEKMVCIIEILNVQLYILYIYIYTHYFKCYAQPPNNTIALREQQQQFMPQ